MLAWPYSLHAPWTVFLVFNICGSSCSLEYEEWRLNWRCFTEVWRTASGKSDPESISWRKSLTKAERMSGVIIEVHSIWLERELLTGLFKEKEAVTIRWSDVITDVLCVLDFRRSHRWRRGQKIQSSCALHSFGRSKVGCNRCFCLVYALAASRSWRSIKD